MQQEISGIRKAIIVGGNDRHFEIGVIGKKLDTPIGVDGKAPRQEEDTGFAYRGRTGGYHVAFL
jgi:hypothetical protein